jgi:WD40 repeat protein
VSAGARRLALGDDRGRVSVWARAEHAAVAEFDTNLAAPVRLLGLSDDGNRVSALTTQQKLGVWALDGPTPAAAGPAYQVPVRGEETWLVRFLPGATRLVSTGRGNAIKVWDLDPVAEKKEFVFFGHSQRVTEMAVSPDGRTLASGSVDGEVKLWDLRTGQELVGLKRHAGPMTAAEFAGSGRVLVTGGTAVGGRGELAFWDAAPE